jgi:hypothetical protein
MSSAEHDLGLVGADVGPSVVGGVSVGEPVASTVGSSGVGVGAPVVASVTSTVQSVQQSHVTSSQSAAIVWRSFISQTCHGISPVRELCDSMMVSSLSMSPRSLGTSPVSPFPSRNREAMNNKQQKLSVRWQSL